MCQSAAQVLPLCVPVSFLRRTDQKILPMEDFKTQFADYLSHTFISSNAPKEERDRIWLEMNAFVQPNIPQKLYRFRPCSLDSFISLEQEAIPVCTASKFRDKYDSLVYVNKERIYQLFDNLFDSGVIDMIYGTNGEDGEILSFVEQQFGKELAETLRTINSELPDDARETVKSKEYFHTFLKGIEPIIQEQITYMQRDRVTKLPVLLRISKLNTCGIIMEMDTQASH